jgi:hypothetical protein
MICILKIIDASCQRIASQTASIASQTASIASQTVSINDYPLFGNSLYCQGLLPFAPSGVGVHSNHLIIWYNH